MLIVTKADAQGNRYILLSTTGSQKYNHVAKLVKQTAAATEGAAYPGTSTAAMEFMQFQDIQQMEQPHL